MLNLKAQVEVKVKPGTKATVSQAMADQLADQVERMIRDFLASNGQSQVVYSFQVKEGNQKMRF